MSIPNSNNLIDQAVEAARKALRAMDGDEIPPKLRKAASSSARKLPPPLFKAVVTELDSSQWLRERALTEMPSADDPTDPARLFLERPDGWEEVLAGRAERTDLEARLKELEAIRRENETLKERIARLRTEMSALTDDTETAMETARKESRERVEALRSRVAALSSELEAAAREKEQLSAQMAGLREQLTQADEKIAELKDKLLKARRTSRPEDTGSARRFGRGSAIETARVLDDLYTTLQPADAPPTVRGAAELSIPANLRPDNREVIDWLIGYPGPLDLLVDGYNVAHILSGADLSGRERLEQSLVELRRLARGPLRIAVYWDSDQDTETHWRSGLAIHYVPSADDAIVAAAGSQTVVVTDDRELRERAGAEGASTIWSRALVQWIDR